MSSYSLPKLLPDADVAELLGVSIATVRRERRRKKLGHVAIGRRVFTAYDQVKEYIQRGRRDVEPLDGDAEGEAKSESQGAVTRVDEPVRRKRIRTELGALKYAYELAEHGTKSADSSEQTGRRNERLLSRKAVPT